MKVCILAQNFPTFSETFVTDHAISLLDSNTELRILANTGQQAAWPTSGSRKNALKDITYLYERPGSNSKNYRLNRIKSLITMGIRHLRNGSPEFLHSLNFLKYGSSVWDLKLPFIYNKALQIGPVDILHCHFGSNGIIGAHLKRLGFCKKLVVTFHGLDVSKVILTKKKSKIYKDLFDQADLILPISNLWREALVSAGAPKQKTFVHHLGVDVDHIPTKVQESIASPKIRIITTARFTEKKGLPVALRGLAEAIKKAPDLELHYDIIGAGKGFAEVAKLIEKLNLSQRVRLHGALPHSRVKALLYSSDIFMLPSHTAKNGDQEGIPVSLMEAMAVGLPVLSTQHSGIPELIENDHSGILVEEKNHHQLADAIIRLAKCHKLRNQLAYNGRKTIEQDFNANKQNKGLIDLYKQILTS
jgi:colanic acid/amylovoran biosynthesis glycosyltransferase